MDASELDHLGPLLGLIRISFPKEIPEARDVGGVSERDEVVTASGLIPTALVDDRCPGTAGD